MAGVETFPVAPPRVSDSAPLQPLPTEPGEIELDASGHLFRRLLRYNNFTGHFKNAMNVWYQYILPQQIASRHLVLQGGRRVHFGDVQCFPPTEYEGNGKKVPLLPHKALNYMLNYNGAVQIVPYLVGPDKTVLDRSKQPVPIGKIPVMKGSWLCHLTGMSDEQLVAAGEDPADPMGYFVYKGCERTVVAQENQRMDKVLVQEEKDTKNVKAFMTCSALTGSTVVSLWMDETLSVSVAMRLFGRNTKKRLPVVEIFRVLLDDLPEGERPAHGTLEETILAMVMNYTQPSRRNKMWELLQMSFWQAARSEQTLTDLIWNAWQLPTHRNDKGVFVPPTGMRPVRSRKEAPVAPVQGAEITSAERKEFVLDEIKKELFPQLAEERPELRINQLALMVARLLEAKAGLRPFNDRDDWVNKRTETSARNCEKLFNALWKKVIDLTQADIDEAKTPVVRLEDAISKLVGHTRCITDDFMTSFTSSNWGPKPYKNVPCMRENVTEILKRESYLAALAQLLKINIPVAREGKIPALRYAHNSQLGYVCVVETPEGVNCGLNKYYGSTCVVSIQRPEQQVRVLLDPMLSGRPGQTPVLLNGKLLGWGNGEAIAERLRLLRRQGTLWMDTCVVLEDGTLYVHCDGARLVRPFLRVNAATGRLYIEELGLWHASWEELMRTACVEYLDPWEAETTFVAQFVDAVEEQRQRFERIRTAEPTPENTAIAARYARARRYTHSEVNPNAILGISALIIPLANHNQAPRNVFQAGMGKQSQGIFHSNHLDRFDTLSRVLANPSRPLFETMTNKMIGLNEAPAGQMAMVAILADPFNQEDAFVLNASSVDRGLFWYTKYISFRAVERAPDTFIDELRKPPPELIKGNPSAYAHIYADGTPTLGTALNPGDVLIGIVRRTTINGAVVLTNESVILAVDEKGVVDKVLVGTNDENKRFIRVKLREVRRPEVGDKLASRSAQKGTVGQLRRQEDMPFTAQGIVPDLLINPHSIPSRMTMGKVVEFIAGKAAALRGRFINASSFRNRTENDFEEMMNDIKAELVRAGHSSSGEDQMYSGATGEMLEAEIYWGPVFYQILKHTVLDKRQARATAGYTRDTRQPIHGKGRKGGLRFGEMERDAVIGHGATALLLERLMKVSDAFVAAYCYNCGTIVAATVDLEHQECRNCGVVGKYGKYTAPYIYKLVTDTLQGVGFNLNFNMVLDEPGRMRAAMVAPVPDEAEEDDEGDEAGGEDDEGDEAGEEEQQVWEDEEGGDGGDGGDDDD